MLLSRIGWVEECTSWANTDLVEWTVSELLSLLHWMSYLVAESDKTGNAIPLIRTVAHLA